MSEEIMDIKKEEETTTEVVASEEVTSQEETVTEEAASNEETPVQEETVTEAAASSEEAPSQEAAVTEGAVTSEGTSSEEGTPQEETAKDEKQMVFDKEKIPRVPRFKRKVCKFCSDEKIVIDYKNKELLEDFITDRGKILPRRVTGTCAKHQRGVAREIKRARIIALIPFVEK